MRSTWFQVRSIISPALLNPEIKPISLNDFEVNQKSSRLEISQSGSAALRSVIPCWSCVLSASSFSHSVFVREEYHTLSVMDWQRLFSNVCCLKFCSGQHVFLFLGSGKTASFLVPVLAHIYRTGPPEDLGSDPPVSIHEMDPNLVLVCLSSIYGVCDVLCSFAVSL